MADFYICLGLCPCLQQRVLACSQNKHRHKHKNNEKNSSACACACVVYVCTTVCLRLRLCCAYSLHYRVLMLVLCMGALPCACACVMHVITIVCLYLYLGCGRPHCRYAFACARAYALVKTRLKGELNMTPSPERNYSWIICYLVLIHFKEIVLNEPLLL